MFINPSNFFFNDPATTEIYTLSLHDALPILNEVRSVLMEKSLTSAANVGGKRVQEFERLLASYVKSKYAVAVNSGTSALQAARSEEHTSELQSPYDLVCRLLLEKKKKDKN